MPPPTEGYAVSWYLLPVEGSVLCLYPLGLRGKGENHLGLQAQGQLLVVLLLCTVTWSLAVLILSKQVGLSLHQKLSKKWGGNLVLNNRPQVILQICSRVEPLHGTSTVAGADFKVGPL